MKFIYYGICLGLVCKAIVATPIIQVVTDALNQTVPNLEAFLQGTSAGLKGALEAGRFQQVIGLLQAVEPLLPTTPSSPEDALQRLLAANATQPATLYDYIANLRALNLIDSIDSLLSFVNGAAEGENSADNNNRDPPIAIYPQKISCDAQYTTPESDLRSAIYIPPNFTYGRKPPIILMPGTGNTGYITFKGNLIPLLQGSDFADPVWVNVPGFLLGDAQISAEFAAYAINYISAITRQNVAISGWSQGNIDIQWAFKYWPSTRLVTNDHVAISPDYAGTILANFITPPGVPTPPSILQQRYLQSANFITTLRNNDGSSAYVPTTTVYSALFDEIVEPQQGKGASAFLLDARGVGVTNNEVQSACFGQLAGSFYTHEGALYNPLTFALLKDAMSHRGPGRIGRLNLSRICSQYLTPDLDLGDFLVTENAIAIAGLGILEYNPKIFSEPPMKDYALSPTCIESKTV